MGDTAIEWTDKSWNPVVGCQKVSPGCKNCYAKSLHDQRHKAYHAGKKVPLQYAKPFEEVQLMPDRLTDPLSWKKPQRVFVNSVSDLFHKDVPDDFIDRVFAVMARSPRHTYQILTKRPERMREYFWQGRQGQVNDAATLHEAKVPVWFKLEESDNVAGPEWPLPNVWLGVSVENQAAADTRIPHLFKVPAAVHFLSMEPLLERVILHKYFAQCQCGHGHGFTACPNTGGVAQTCHLCDCRKLTPKIGWIIVGGESGPDSRTFRIEWARSIIDQCKHAGVACFVKQLGQNSTTTLPNYEAWPGHSGPLSPVQFHGDGFGNYRVSGLKYRKGGDVEEWPVELRIRQFPAAKGAPIT